MKEQLMNSYDFINNLNKNQEGINFEKLEILAYSFNLKNDPEILQEMIILASKDGKRVTKEDYIELLNDLKLIDDKVHTITK